MLQLVKPCNQCNVSGETNGTLQEREICPKCNGLKYEVDYDSLQYFQRKVWDRLPNERIISLVQEIDEAIRFVESLPDHPKGFLSQLYYVRGQFFDSLAGSVSENKLGYFYEARRSFRISRELDEKISKND